MSDFVPLSVHSQYSILESTLSVGQIADIASNQELKSVALTDFGNMYGAVDFYIACQEKNIHSIFGCELLVAPFSRSEKKKLPGHPVGYPIVLLVKDQIGYKNLCALSSIAFTEGFYYYPRIDLEILQKHAEGLICLSGPLQSRIAQLAVQEQQEDRLEKTTPKEALNQEVEKYQKIFGEDFVLQVFQHPYSEDQLIQDEVNQETWLYQKFQDAHKKEKQILETVGNLSKDKGILCVATSDIRYKDREDWRAHEILMNIGSKEPCEIIERDSLGRDIQRTKNPKRKTMYSHDLYFPTPQQMQQRFSAYPEYIENTKIVADKCNYAFDLNKRFYPVFVPPELQNTTYTQKERLKSVEEHLRGLCETGIKVRYTPEKLQKVSEKYPEQDPMQVVKERLDYELKVITSKGMCDYLLIVYDFIHWAKEQKIPVGPGRGSGAGSIILYLIGITDIEPLRFNLLFERFINPERTSYPDIDVDICFERRSEVIDYITEKYGKDRVAQIITFGTMKAKMAIKDVGRVLSVSLKKVNTLAKLIPDEGHTTIAEALQVDTELQNLYKEDKEVQAILDVGQKVEGVIRNTGIHAAGIIISGDPLTEHIPICIAKDAAHMVTQFSMKPVEKVGMLKMDVLGLKTLTSIQKTLEAIERRSQKIIDPIDIPLEDAKTFSLLRQGKTSGIFQLESTGMQELIRKLQIDSFEELIAVTSLYRPGPMEMIPSYVQRKHGAEKIEYDHPWVQDILAETYGIMVYQEQVMQIASTLAGYSLGEGDVLRRAMGKKDHKEMQGQREKFQKGAEKKGIDIEKSMSIFDKIAKFASYGFNKSHATAYSFVGYVTAFLKANYPKEWMAALMACDRSDITKVAKHIRECRHMQIDILPPDVNESCETFVATDQGIRFALTAIRGVGQGVVEAIVHTRQKKGNFTSLEDFLEKIDFSSVGKKVTECLIWSGCFDFTTWSRQELCIFLQENFDCIVKEQKEKECGFLDLFANIEKSEAQKPQNVKEPDLLEILSQEKELLGFYITAHPLDLFQETLQELECVNLADLQDLSDQTVARVGFVVDSIQVRMLKGSDKKFAILTVSQDEESLELPVWSELYQKNIEILQENTCMFAVVQIDKREDNLRLQTKWFAPLQKDIDPTILKEFQEAFSQAQKMAKKFSSGKKSSFAKKSDPKTPQKCIEIVLDANQVTLKKVLSLKNIFQNFPGKDLIKCVFKKNQNKIATLFLDARTSVDAGEELEESLRSLPYILDFNLEKEVKSSL